MYVHLADHNAHIIICIIQTRYGADSTGSQHPTQACVYRVALAKGIKYNFLTILLRGTGSPAEYLQSMCRL
jgi:hypothetical protein